MTPLLKRFAETGGYLGFLCGALAIVIQLCGGHLPPWASYADAQTIMNRQNSEATTQSLLAEDFYCDKLERARDDAHDHPSSHAAQDDVRRLQDRVRRLEQTITPGVPVSRDPC
jgi:hypothetical protein